jgi:diguanylate cyclase (GGDEF)-like protein
VLSAVCLGGGAAGILGVTRHLYTVQAERSAARQAEFTVAAVLADELDASDFRRPVSPQRRAQLDRLLANDVLRHGTLLVTLSGPQRMITYATDHAMIGRRVASAARTADALAGTVSSDVTTVAAGGPRERLKTLRSYVPYGSDAGVAGAIGLHQDYAPIARAARSAFLPVAGILQLVLLVLFALLVPLLARVSRRIVAQIERIEYQASHDDLTELPNRFYFRKQIAAALAAAEHEASSVCILLLDLDRFKEINETLGHRSGDVLLGQLSDRLRATLAADVVLARLGGDEFGIVVARAPADGAVRLGALVHALLDEPFVVDSIPLVVEASIGAATSPRDGEDADALIRRADIAMQDAKDRRLGFREYAPELDTRSAAQLALMSELRRALDENELTLFFQPKADLVSGAVLSVEALVRWEHPVRGLLLPGEFVPLAERTGISRGLSRYVLASGIRRLREWADEGFDIGMSLNLTMFDLLDAKLPDEVAEMLSDQRVDAGRLELEITESVIMADPVRVREVVERLKALGVRLAIDDFGTGFSSLTYLKTLPIDILKIDRSFVMGMDENDGDRAIVSSTTQLAHNLGLAVVAEGVESDAIWQRLQAIGCDLAQGFHIGRPCRAEDLAALLTDWHERARPLVAASRAAA